MPTAETPYPAGSAMLLDYSERIFVLVLLSWFVVRLIPVAGDHASNALLLLSESITALLIVFRKRGAPAASVYAWKIAIVGTCGSLFVIPQGVVVVPPSIGVILLSAGLCFSLLAKLSLGRSFGIVAANRGVKMGGPYRFVRHPIYLGYSAVHLGFLVVHLSVWNVLVYAITWTALIMRIGAEERILSQDSEYRRYRESVRFKLVPGIY